MRYAVGFRGGGEGLFGLVFRAEVADDVEPLGAHPDGAVRSLSAMHPCRSGVHQRGVHPQHVFVLVFVFVDGGEADGTHNVVEQLRVGGVQNQVTGVHSGAGHIEVGVDALHGVEEREFVAFAPVVVVGDKGLAELGHGGLRGDDEVAQREAAHQHAVLVHCTGNGVQRATGELVGSEHASAAHHLVVAQEHGLTAVVGLDEEVVVRLARGLVFERTRQPTGVKLVVGREVAELATVVHLSVRSCVFHNV